MKYESTAEATQTPRAPTASSSCVPQRAAGTVALPFSGPAELIVYSLFWIFSAADTRTMQTNNAPERENVAIRY